MATAITTVADLHTALMGVNLHEKVILDDNILMCGSKRLQLQTGRRETMPLPQVCLETIPLPSLPERLPLPSSPEPVPLPSENLVPETEDPTPDGEDLSPEMATFALQTLEKMGFVPNRIPRLERLLDRNVDIFRDHKTFCDDLSEEEIFDVVATHLTNSRFVGQAMSCKDTRFELDNLLLPFGKPWQHAKPYEQVTGVSFVAGLDCKGLVRVGKLIHTEDDLRRLRRKVGWSNRLFYLTGLYEGAPFAIYPGYDCVYLDAQPNTKVAALSVLLAKLV